MRIWDISPTLLCQQHLLGEHRELHALWTILSEHKKGYAKHPETKRWRNKLSALYIRHETLVAEMTKRGYKHKSDLNPSQATGSKSQTEFIHTPEEQIEILRSKQCDCNV